ncbi:sialic acid-binding Ig-like lectin 12 [Chrysemys picta bellii]|uniref:sialic acid-binding Ig-like lectin 12 n=1 Tax=Chrysemys picta bellii TaxID=8478 RepID=UPI0032B233D8
MNTITSYLSQPPCSPVSVSGGIRPESWLLTQAHGPGRLSALSWTEMALVLVPAFCLLSGAYAQEWNVTLAPGPLGRRAGSCVTIPCNFTYPAGWNVSSVSWTRDGDQIVYHSDEARVHAAFKGRARYLGDLQHNCSLRVVGLRPSDQGTYRFQFEAVRNGSSDRQTTRAEQQLSVSGNQVPPSTPGSTQGPWIT